MFLVVYNVSAYPLLALKLKLNCVFSFFALLFCDEKKKKFYKLLLSHDASYGCYTASICYMFCSNKVK